MRATRRMYVLCTYASALALASCKPDVGDRDSLVTRERVIAVVASPAEARPESSIAFTVIVAAPGGPTTGAPASWAYCATPKLITENTSVSATCAAPGLHDGVRGVPGADATLVAPLPKDACVLFGPDVPPGEFRPRDADTTGGYYQPLRVMTHGDTAFGFARVTCNLPQAGSDVTKEYNDRYAPNVNPALLPLVATPRLDAVPAGAAVSLTASWPAAAVESYVSYDRASQTVAARRESMRMSWYANAGTFASDKNGRDENDAALFVDNVWTAPDVPGVAHLWLVLRDARGGTAVADYAITVR